MAKPQNRRGLLERCDHACVQQNIAVDLALVDCDDPLLAELARSIEKTAHGHAPGSLALWRPIPGVGNILALVMRYESEPITRFPRGQAFVSSCRLVKSAQEAHGKRYGPSGKKIGHAHLTWAVAEAAGLFLKNNEPAQTYLAKLATRHGKGKALSILAPKLGRAVYCMLKPHVAFDQEKFLATEAGGSGSAWRLPGAIGASGTPPAHRAERSGSWAMSPRTRCLCRAAVPVSWRVDWRCVPLLTLAATRTHAWLTRLPLPRAQHSRDGMCACRASGVDWDGTRAQPCFQVAQRTTRCAAAAHCGRLEPRYVCGAGPLLVPKPGCGNQAVTVNRPKVREGSGEKNASLFRAWRSLPIDSRRPYKG